MPTRSPLPVTRAILIADSILTEEGTHKKSLIGVYSRIGAADLPFRRLLQVYLQLADAQGEYSFDIKLVRLDSEEAIHTGTVGPLQAPDRLVPLEIVMRIPCVFRAYGEYELRLSHEGQFFASCRLTVTAPHRVGRIEPYENES